MRSGERRLVRTMVYEAFDRFESDVEARNEFLRARCEGNPEVLSIAMEEVAAEERIRKARFLEMPAASAFSAVIPEGTEIGDYRIGKLIGEGAMGAVYRARQISLDRDVAIKTLRTPLATQAGWRFRAEARILSKIASPRVVHVYGYGDYNGQPYIAMEYCEGTNLAQMIAETGTDDVRSRLAIGLQVAEGLEQIHGANVAHRDVKPSNVLVDGNGNVKLIDFGIAWREDSRMTEIGQVLGTPAYMPPELILRKLGGSATDVEQYKRVDIYSFGILLYELFTGALPFQSETRGEVEREIVHTPVRLEPLRERQVPEGVVELIRLATSKNPAARPRSFTEVVHVLRIYATDSGSKAMEPAPRHARVGRPGKWIAALGAVAAVSLGFEFWTTRAVLPPLAVARHEAPPSAVKASGDDRPGTLPSAAGAILPAPRPVETPSSSQPSPPPKAAAAAPAPGRQESTEPKQMAGPVPFDRPAQTPTQDASRPLPVHETLPVEPPADRTPLPVESAEDREWDRVHASGDAAAVRSFRALYPAGRHSTEARRLASAFEYDAVKGSKNPQVLKKFAEDYPEHPFARAANSLARQLESQAAAAGEILETLKRYAAAFERMKVDGIEAVRELNKPQRDNIKNTFENSSKIQLTLIPKGSPQFLDPLVPDPAAADNLPSKAVIEAEQTTLVFSGRGEVKSYHAQLTIYLKRTGKGWIITAL